MKTLKLINSILEKRERIGFLVLFLGMFINSLLEIIGLAILVPVVNIVAYPESAIANSWYLQLFVRAFRIPDGNTKLLLGVVVAFVALVYVFKTIYLFIFQFWQQKFIHKFSRRLSTALFANYLYQPYEFHVYHNTATLISRATYDVTAFVNAVNMLLSLASDVLFFAVTFAYLMVNEWAMTLIIFAGLGFVAVLLNVFFKKKAKKYGKAAAIINARSYKAVSEGLAGIKETKISNREEYFINNFDETKKTAQNLSIRQSVIGIIPRSLVEMFGMLGMLVGLYVYYLLGNPPEQIVGTFTLMALAVIKLLPYVTRIAAYINSLRGAQWSIQKVGEDVRLIRETPAMDQNGKSSQALSFETAVTLNDISFQYRSSDSPVLKHINAVIPKGKSVAFCGRSGAGKTTTVDVLLGLLKPQSGQVLCDGVDVSSDLNGWHKNLSYVPQDIYLIDDTIRANVAFGLDPSVVDDRDVWRALKKAQLADFVRSLPKQLNSEIGEKGVRLSGGQRQRIGIARALYRDTPIMVLDEATSALDYETESEILNAVEGLRGEKTLIIITHRLNTISACDYIYQIENNEMKCIQEPGK